MQIVFLKAFSAYPVTPMSVVDFVQGALNPRQEILALLPVLQLTGKSTAAAFTLADNDIDLLTAAFVAKERASWMNIPDAINQVPDAERDISNYAMTADLAQLDVNLRNGGPVNAVGGAAIIYNVFLPIPFMNSQKEHPNVSAYSAGQLYSSARVDLDVIANGLPFNVVLTGGTIAISAVAGQLFALTGSIRPVLWMAPAQKSYQRAASNTAIESEGGPLLDDWVSSVQDAANFPNADDNVSIVIDGKTYTFQTALHNLPFAYSGTTQANQLSCPGYDSAQNTKRKTRTTFSGRVPFIYATGLTAPVENELPAAASGRALNFGPKTTAAPNLLFWRHTAITSDENLKFLATMLQDSKLQPYFSERTLSASQIQQIKNLAFGDMAVYGGGSSGPGAMNADLSLFKPRMFAPAG